jgi:hypothetical protein
MKCINYSSAQCASSGHYCPYTLTADPVTGYSQKTCIAYQGVEETVTLPAPHTDKELKAFGKQFARTIVQEVFK